MASINSHDELHKVEIDGALLLSQLLDESHVEDCDDERLMSVIRSLEAEIIEPIVITKNDDSFMELELDDNFVEICGYTLDRPQEDAMEGRDCSSSSDSADIDNYNWMMDVEDIHEFGGVGDDYYHYSRHINDINNVNHNSYGINTLEEQSYGSLW